MIRSTVVCKIVLAATLLTSLTLLTACPPPATEPFTLVIAAKKGAAGVVARDAIVAYRDGFEATSDGEDEGVDVVAAERGKEIFRSPSDASVVRLALGATSLASIELATSILDQRVRIRSLDGGGAAVDVERVEAPLAIVAVDDVSDGNGSTVPGYLWVEAAFDGPVDGQTGIGNYTLTIVEAREDGVVAKRTDMDIDGGVQQAFGLLAPIPGSFGVVVGGDNVFFGVTAVGLCNGSSVLYRASRANGTGGIEWTGRVAAVGPTGSTCDCDDTAVDNVSDRGNAVAVVDGTPVVVGGVVECASVVEARGFVRTGDDQVEVDESLRFVASRGAQPAAVASPSTVFGSLQGTTPLSPVKPPHLAAPRITGLATVGGETIAATDDGIFTVVFTPPNGD